MKIFTFVILSTISVMVHSQSGDWCGTDMYDALEMEKDPSILEKRAELESFTNQYLQSKSKATDTLVIPVVFHVLHMYGPEHISYEEIQYGIQQINKDFNAENTELDGVISDFKDIIGNVRLEFRLAKLDPDGNCTNGVVYYETDLTYFASNDLKYEIQNWDPNSYLNIWTVSSIASGAAAWSHYPGISPTLDGVVTKHQYVSGGHTLSHEIGHYLNLAHPWGSTNEPGLQSNCSIDDNVGDTPLTIGADQHCNLNQESCGSLDNVQNFMDYSTCDAMFTIGQVDRMRAALNSSISGRKYLWTEANLMETGTSNNYVDPGCGPIADFKSSFHFVCPNSVIEFKNFSNASEITQWEWSFEGGTPSVSTEQNPQVFYSVPGYYDVSLTVRNSYGENTLLRENNVFITDTLQGIIAPILFDMEESSFPLYEDNPFKAWTFEDGGNSHWEEKYIGNNTMRIKNYGNNSETINSMITSNINLSKIENPDYIYFDMAYAQRNSSSGDELKVYVSPDCGNKWIVKYIKSGLSLVTNGGNYVTNEFVPGNSDWKTESINISNYSEANYLKIKFQMESNGGNYLYIDDIKIGEPEVTGNRINEGFNFRLFPNPAKETLQIDYYLSNNQNINIQIFNVIGQKVYSETNYGVSGLNSKTLDLSTINIKTGVYSVTVNTHKQRLSERLIIID